MITLMLFALSAFIFYEAFLVAIGAVWGFILFALLIGVITIIRKLW